MDKCKLENQNDEMKIAAYIDMLRNLSVSTDDYLFLWELESNLIWFTDNIVCKYDLVKDEKGYCTMKNWCNIIFPKDLLSYKENIDRLTRGEDSVLDMEYRLIDRNGNHVWISCRGSIQMDEQGKRFAMVGSVSETVLKHKVDALTGMFNKTKMLSELDDVLAAGPNVYLLILGVDNLKNINIKYGREQGNQVLRRVAKILEEAVENHHRVYKLDGDCFALCLPWATQEEVENTYRKIQKSVTSFCTISAGAASLELVQDKDTSTLYQFAELALEKAKKAGKNVLAFFSEEDYKQRVSQIELLTELEESANNGCTGFYLFYQPQMKAGNYQIFGAEALLRYDSPTRGRVFPDQFIPLLEQHGLICPVGLWVLETALAQCKIWRKEIPNFHISVNVSYIQLKEPDIMQKVLNVLERSGLPGDALTLEVTESVQLQDFSRFNDIFTEWKAAGIEISVDDFGTGYSSLAYLKNLNIDEIKIDRCFVSGIQRSSYNYQLLSNMLELAANSQIRVCCEGVEEEDELHVLEELRPDLLQGYLFSKPCEANEFEQKYFSEEGGRKYAEQIKHINKMRKKNLGELLNLQPRDILRATELGLWVIRIDEQTKRYELYADETMRRLMEANRDLSPQECYQFWYNRINEGYCNYVNRSVRQMISGDKIVQLQYTWNHPSLGEVQIRCVGVRTDDNDGMICLEGYHRMISNIEQTQFLDDAPSYELFEYNERRSAVYFHTKRTLLAGKDIHEYNFPQGWIEEKIVHLYFAKEFEELFCNVSEKKDVNDVEMMLKTPSGEYDWFRVSTRHLSEEENDRYTIVVRVRAANQERKTELENRRIREFYRAVLAETIAYAELDIEGWYLEDTGGLWGDSEKTFHGKVEEFLQYIIENQHEYTKYHKNEHYRIGASVEDMAETIKKGNEIPCYVYMRRVEGEWRWVELSVKIFQEPFSGNRYALLCLKDIDAQKKREIKQIEAEETDSLTQVYNRRAFEKNFREYLAGEGDTKQGVLMLLDINHFKTLNETFGYRTGDKVLQYVAECLRTEFAKDSIIGRLGADEFLVFTKGTVEKEQFNKRMEALHTAMENGEEVAVQCNAGIAFVDNKDFSYKKCMNWVEKALYWSKHSKEGCYQWADAI